MTKRNTGSSFLEIFSGTQEVMHFMLPATTAICLAQTEEELGSSHEWWQPKQPQQKLPQGKSQEKNMLEEANRSPNLWKLNHHHKAKNRNLKMTAGSVLWLSYSLLLLQSVVLSVFTHWTTSVWLINSYGDDCCSATLNFALRVLLISSIKGKTCLRYF